ncbi:MAG TPA: hypothetical protein VGQ37_17340 [Vicinamibacterales bacterium]|jgi:hypothetical protein|nr:hypothetical protein [Vicinamibacterales bacterium]
MSRVTFFVAPDHGQSAGAPLRLAVPCVPAAEGLLLDALRVSAPPGARETSLELGPKGPEAELALLDYWTDLPAADRGRVWAVTGSLAGALARFEDRPAQLFAVVGAAESRPDRPINGRTRSLLMAAHPDTWTLAAECAPDVDADTWRARLVTVINTRWAIGHLDQPAAALTALARQWGLDSTRLATVSVSAAATAALPAGDAADCGWLDAELPDVLRTCLRAPATPSHDIVAPPDGEASESGAPRAVRGRRGRLYLANDSHDSHRQILGERPLTPHELDTWEQGTAARAAWLSSLGSRFVHLIGPAPQVVHPEDLPDAQAPSPSRPALQLLERLAANAPLLYPIDELRAVRACHAPFSLTDSHWNDLGAYVAYEAVLAHLDDGVRVRRVERGDVAFQRTVYVGDLGCKLRPERASTFLRARLDDPRARIVEDNRVRNHGRRVVYECATAPATTCVVFGDSWAYPMMLFLAETFRRTVFLHRVNVVDRRPVEAERPDVVLVVMTERFCDAVPNDGRAVDFDHLAGKKTRKGDVVPLPQPGQRHEFLYSLALDRQLRPSNGVRLPVSAAPGTLA